MGGHHRTHPMRKLRRWHQSVFLTTTGHRTSSIFSYYNYLLAHWSSDYLSKFQKKTLVVCLQFFLILF